MGISPGKSSVTENSHVKTLEKRRNVCGALPVFFHTPGELRWKSMRVTVRMSVSGSYKLE